jgi:hypothetical protein
MTVDSSVNCSLRYYKAYIAEPGTVCAELDIDSGLLVEETRKSWNAMGEIPESHEAEVVVQGHPRTASVVVKLLRLYKDCSIARGQECGLLLVGFDPEIDLPFEGYLYIPKIVIQSVVEEEYFDDEEEDYDDNSYTVTSVGFVDGETHSMLRQTWEPHPTEQICYVEAFQKF